MDALAEHIKTNQPVTWHLFERELDLLDLTKEPSESLSSLYASRARELRDQYDHLVLHFSGGTDTDAIVSIFANNGIDIDELFIRTYDRDSRHNEFILGRDPEGREAEDLTLPLAKHIKETYWPNIKITHVDYSTGLIDRLKNNPRWYEDYRSCSIDPNSIMRSDWDMLVPEWRQMAEKGIRIGHIVGKEKPVVRVDSRGFYFYYADNDHQDYISPRKLDLPYHVEMFFWDPTTIKMQLKQSHVIMKHWAQMKNHQDPEKWFTRAYEDEIANLIYPKRILPFLGSTLKRSDMGYVGGAWKQQSRWFVEDKNTDHFRIWSKGAIALYDQVKPLYANKVEFLKKGFPKFSTKRHYIT